MIPFYGAADRELFAIERSALDRPGHVGAGDDDFCAMSLDDIAQDLTFRHDAGFDVEVVDTVFAFESLDDAARLQHRFFGPGTTPRIEIEFRVAVMVTPSRGVG